MADDFRDMLRQLGVDADVDRNRMHLQITVPQLPNDLNLNEIVKQFTGSQPLVEFTEAVSAQHKQFGQNLADSTLKLYQSYGDNGSLISRAKVHDVATSQSTTIPDAERNAALFIDANYDKIAKLNGVDAAAGLHINYVNALAKSFDQNVSLNTKFADPYLDSPERNREWFKGMAWGALEGAGVAATIGLGVLATRNWAAAAKLEPAMSRLFKLSAPSAPILGAWMQSESALSSFDKNVGPSNFYTQKHDQAEALGLNKAIYQF